jgi:hypothetical protein
MLMGHIREEQLLIAQMEQGLDLLIPHNITVKSIDFTDLLSA